jgi:hypothetical protein
VVYFGPHPTLEDGAAVTARRDGRQKASEATTSASAERGARFVPQEGGWQDPVRCRGTAKWSVQADDALLRRDAACGSTGESRKRRTPKPQATTAEASAPEAARSGGFTRSEMTAPTWDLWATESGDPHLNAAPASVVMYTSPKELAGKGRAPAYRPKHRQCWGLSIEGPEPCPRRTFWVDGMAIDPGEAPHMLLTATIAKKSGVHRGVDRN